MLLKTLALLSLFTVAHANFTNWQNEVMESKREIHNLQILLADLRAEQEELRQMSNDHVLVHWLKDTVLALRKEIEEFVVQEADWSAREKKWQSDLKEMKLEIRELTIQEHSSSEIHLSKAAGKATKSGSGHHLKVLSEEINHLRQEMRHLAQKRCSCGAGHHHHRRRGKVSSREMGGSNAALQTSGEPHHP